MHVENKKQSKKQWKKPANLIIKQKYIARQPRNK